MTPFAKPIAALFAPFVHSQPEAVAIIAMDEEDYVAVDREGKTVAGPHGVFEIVGDEVRRAVWYAHDASMGS